MLILLLRKSELIAYSTVILSSSIIYFTLFNQVQGIETPVLLSWQLSVPQVVDYLERVHFPTYTHVPPFFAGIIIAHLLQNKRFLFNVSFVYL